MMKFAGSARLRRRPMVAKTICAAVQHGNRQQVEDGEIEVQQHREPDRKTDRVVGLGRPPESEPDADRAAEIGQGHIAPRVDQTPQRAERRVHDLGTQAPRMSGKAGGNWWRIRLRRRHAPVLAPAAAPPADAPAVPQDLESEALPGMLRQVLRERLDPGYRGSVDTLKPVSGPQAPASSRRTGSILSTITS